MSARRGLDVAVRVSRVEAGRKMRIYEEKKYSEICDQRKGGGLRKGEGGYVR
jgi:hypothetical protein